MNSGASFNSLMNIKINEIENKYKQKFIEFEVREQENNKKEMEQ